MACHELAALRLGLMRVLGRNDEAERTHELAEIGEGAAQPGPIKSLSEASDLSTLKRFFEAALVDLDRKVSSAGKNAPDLPYLRSLQILTKKVELDLRNEIDAMTRLYQDLEEMHDFVHEIYPAE
ncbi:MAG TPA: DUF3209 family protein [Planctomycetota bacterium]|nr:DUF3209 family protein [Planctomycetota bacterium]